MLLITHDLGIVHGMAHRVALMYAGQIVEVTDTARFFAQPRHPYAQLLLKALPGAGKRGDPLAAIAGTVPALTGPLPFSRPLRSRHASLRGGASRTDRWRVGGCGDAACSTRINRGRKVAPAAASAAPSPDAKPDPPRHRQSPRPLARHHPRQTTPSRPPSNGPSESIEAALEPAASRSIPSVPERAVAIPERTESAREPEMTAGRGRRPLRRSASPDIQGGRR